MSQNKTSLMEGMDAKMSDTPEAKKPCKGILKTSSSFDRQSTSSMGTYRKNAKFDETNVMQTYHPADKDYGHMKVDEPKTPFVFTTDSDPGKDFDADLLAEKLRVAANTQSPGFVYDNEDSEEEFEESLTERVHRLEFEKRRKAHYNEFKAVLLARKLIQVELEADSEEDCEQKTTLEREATGSLYESDERTSSKLPIDTSIGTDEASSIDNTASPISRPMDVEHHPISACCNHPNSDRCHCYKPH